MNLDALETASENLSSPFASPVTIQNSTRTAEADHYLLHSPEHYTELLLRKAKGQYTVHKQ